MSPLLYYLLQVVIASGILYLYYHIALRNKKFHQYNRFYLLGAVVISILVPFLDIPVYFTPQETKSSIVFETLTVISAPVAEPTPVIESPAMVESVAPVSTFNPYVLIYYAYILIALLALIRIGFSLVKISRLKRNNEVEKIDKIFFVNTNEPGTPFSYFRWLFWNRNIELNSEKGEQIFRHELFHIQQKHSIDLLFMELLTVVLWINPFFHLIKKELRTIHEFLADQFALTKSNRWDYAELLIMHALNTKQALVNPFFHNQIKRRIAMIINPKKTSYRYLRKLLVLPFAVLIFTAFAFEYKKSTEKIVPAKENITVIIETGKESETEKDLHIQQENQILMDIAQTIHKLSNEYNINVILDKQTNQSTDDEELFKERLTSSRKAGAAAFISLAVKIRTVKKGTEYVSTITNKNNKNGSLIAKALLMELSPGYDSSGSLTIFNNSETDIDPGIVECTLSTNADNLYTATEKENQEKIARNVLTALVKYSNMMKSVPAVFKEIYNTDDEEYNGILYLHDRNIIINCEWLIDHNAKGSKDLMTSGKRNSLFIIDGNRVDYSYIQKHKLYAKTLHIYLPNNPDAIRLFGPEAVRGVVAMTGVSILEHFPNGIVDATSSEYLQQQRDGAFRFSEKVIFEKIDMEAMFPGGESDWREFLEDNLDANVPVQNGAKEGTYTVTIQFTVDEEGYPADFKALTNNGYQLEEESLRCIQKVEKWIPAIKNGKPISSLKKRDFIFRVTNE